jgi:hypothetical protein
MEDKNKEEKKVKHYIEIGDNIFWAIFWIGVFILMAMDKC